MWWEKFIVKWEEMGYYSIRGPPPNAATKRTHGGPPKFLGGWERQTVGFRGEYRHSMDSKGRVSLPAKFRKMLPDDLTIVPVPNKDFGKALYVFTDEAFDEWVEGFFDEEEGGRNPRSKKHIGMYRFLEANADSVTVDAAGRIKLSAKQCGAVGIDKDVAIIGVGDHIEIWDSETYDEYMASIDPFGDFIED